MELRSAGPCRSALFSGAGEGGGPVWRSGVLSLPAADFLPPPAARFFKSATRVLMAVLRPASQAVISSSATLPMPSSMSMPCSRRSISSCARTSFPSWAATKTSSMAWASSTTTGRSTIRAAPLMEWPHERGQGVRVGRLALQGEQVVREGGAVAFRLLPEKIHHGHGTQVFTLIGHERFLIKVLKRAWSSSRPTSSIFGRERIPLVKAALEPETVTGSFCSVPSA